MATATEEMMSAATRAPGDAQRSDGPAVAMPWELAPDMMATTDVAGYLTRVNPAWERALGYTRDELMSRPYLDFVHPDDVARTRAAADTLVDPGHPSVRFENRCRARDGSYHWLAWSCWSGPEEGTTYCIVRDVTRIHDAESERDTLLERLRVRDQLLNGVVENNLSLIYVKDLDGRYLLYNQRFADAFLLDERGRAEGQSGREVLLGRDDIWLDPELEPEWRRHDIQAANEALYVEEWSDHPTRGRLTYDSIKFPLYNEAGRVHAICGVSLETTQRRQALEQAQEAEERFRSAFQDAPIGMALTALDGRILRANRALRDISGYDEAALLEMSIEDITHPDDLGDARERLQALRAGAVNTNRGEKRLFNASGHVVWVEASRSLVRDAHGLPHHMIVQVQDVSDRRRLEERLRYLADVDSLTGVRTRRLFEEDLRTQVARCKRYGEHAAVLMLDLDGLKELNDTFGHKAGDDMLKAVATALKRRLRTGDQVGRLGGDEFGVLLVNVTGATAEAVAADLRRSVSEATITVGDHALSGRASVGIALIDEHTVDIEAALAHADRAMYVAKGAAGGGRARESG